MGTYVYTLKRSKPLKTPHGNVYRLGFLCRYSNLDPYLYGNRVASRYGACIEAAKERWTYPVEDVYYVVGTGVTLLTFGFLVTW